jgi:transposase InsO family protein
MTSFYSNGIYYELTLYFDTFNREIVGFGLTDRKGDIKPYFEGLEQVIKRIKEKEQTISSTLHTDQGSVYSSEAFNKLLNNNNIVHSMSRAGTPTDNPIDESLNGWIKDELFIDFNLKKCDDVLSLIKEYINYYNYERPMYCLKYKTPHQFKTEMGYLCFFELSTFC